MTGQRSYDDPCGIARALDVIGERWALLIVRELLYGPKRFTDLRVVLGASPNVLTQRLSELEQGGVVQRRTAGGALYDLTTWGRDLYPFLVQLGRWGARSPHRPAGQLSIDALMLALEATFVPDNARDLSACYELRLAEERFAVSIDCKTISIVRGSLRGADAGIETDPGTLRALVFGDKHLAGAPVTLTGDMRVARRFFRLFARP